jgi:tetratricopeptide (TPR) repeat protein
VSAGQVLADLIGLDGRLRMVPADAAALAAETGRLLAGARAARETGDVRGEWRSARSAGVGLLVLGRHRLAREALERAHELAAALADPLALAVTAVNLGDAHRYAGDPVAAEPLYRGAVALARAGRPGVLDFALHHLGKHLLERAAFAEAGDCLREALRLRRDRGDASLIASTQAALRLLDADARAAGPRDAGAGSAGEL